MCFVCKFNVSLDKILNTTPMKKTILTLAILFVSAASFAQTKPEMIFNKDTNLIEATYFHENGTVSQKGTFNTDKKLHGEWVSYNQEGKTTTVGSYANGVKTGKWFFWANDTLKEVAYNNNTIVVLNETKNTEGIVSID